MLNAPFWQVAALRAAWRRLLEMARHPLPPSPGYETLRGW